MDYITAITEALKQKQSGGWKACQLLAKAKKEQTPEEFKATVAATGLKRTTISNYVRAGGDEGINWLVDNNIIKTDAMTMQSLTGIPLETVKVAAAAGRFDGVNSKTAIQLRRQILADAGHVAPKAKGGRPSRQLADRWPEEFRTMASHLIHAATQANRATAALVAQVDKLREQGMDDAGIRNVVQEVLGNHAHYLGVSHSGDTVEVGQGVTMTLTQREMADMDIVISLRVPQ